MVVSLKLKGNKKVRDNNVKSCFAENGVLHIVKANETLKFPMSDVVHCYTNSPMIPVRGYCG